MGGGWVIQAIPKLKSFFSLDVFPKESISLSSLFISITEDSMAKEVEALKNNMVKKTELQENMDRLGCLLTVKQ